MVPQDTSLLNSEPSSFPEVAWETLRVRFFLPAETTIEALSITAALVFVLHPEGFVVADITGRGWCIPGGRLEIGETPEEAVRREAIEEAGAVLGPLTLLGTFVLTDTVSGEIQRVPTYVAGAVSLGSLPPDTESRGICILSLAELPARYFRWDALLEAVFRYALATLSSENYPACYTASLENRVLR